MNFEPCIAGNHVSLEHIHVVVVLVHKRSKGTSVTVSVLSQISIFSSPGRMSGELLSYRRRPCARAQKL